MLAYEFVCILARNKIEINVNNLDKFNPHPGVKVTLDTSDEKLKTKIKGFFLVHAAF